MSYIIAIAGPPGSGKSSLVRSLVGSLGDAAALSFDHYENITGKPPREIKQWLAGGADFDRFVVPGLAGDLQRLKEGEAITDPVSRELVVARKYVIFEMPFGKAQVATAAFIDRLLWIDLPLDVALARTLREHTGIFIERFPPDKHRECLTWLHGYLDGYLDFVHQVLAVQHQKVRPGADLLIDGRDDLEGMTRKALQFINSELP